MSTTVDMRWGPIFQKPVVMGSRLRGNDKQLAHVAALGIVERGGAQVDPVGGGEVADRDRFLLLQGDHEDLAVVGRLSAREGDRLDLVALAYDGLERLLLLRARRRRQNDGKERNGKGAELRHGSLLESRG